MVIFRHLVAGVHHEIRKIAVIRQNEHSLGHLVKTPDGIAMIGVSNTEAVRVTLQKGKYTIRKTVEVPRFLYAPVRAGDRVGQVVYRDNGELLAVVPLYAVTDAALYIRPRLWQRIFSAFKNKTK